MNACGGGHNSYIYAYKYNVALKRETVLYSSGYRAGKVNSYKNATQCTVDIYIFPTYKSCSTCLNNCSESLLESTDFTQ